MTDKFFALYWCLCVSLSIILFIKWSETLWNGSECEDTDLGWYFRPWQPPILSRSVCNSHKVVDLSYFNMHNWALLQYNQETESSFTKYHQARREIELSCNSALHKHKNTNWKSWRGKRVCLSEGYMSRPLLVNSLMAYCFTLFSVLKHYTLP